MEVYAKSVVTDTIILNQYLLLYVPVFIFSNILSVQTRVGELVGKGVIPFHIDVYLPVVFMCHHNKRCFLLTRMSLLLQFITDF